MLLGTPRHWDEYRMLPDGHVFAHYQTQEICGI